jgi:hypothetical protein
MNDMMIKPRKRIELTDYLNQLCLCKGKVIKKEKGKILLRQVRVNEIYINHLWIKSKMLEIYPNYNFVYFTGFVESYQRHNFRQLSYTIMKITIISRYEYDQKSRRFIFTDKPLLHNKKRLNELIEKIRKEK